MTVTSESIRGGGDHVWRHGPDPDPDPDPVPDQDPDPTPDLRIRSRLGSSSRSNLDLSPDLAQDLDTQDQASRPRQLEGGDPRRVA